MKKILVSAFVILALFSGVVSAQDNIEKKKIEFLISSIENLKGAIFIRNGSEYDGKASRGAFTNETSKQPVAGSEPLMIL